MKTAEKQTDFKIIANKVFSSQFYNTLYKSINIRRYKQNKRQYNTYNKEKTISDEKIVKVRTEKNYEIMINKDTYNENRKNEEKRTDYKQSIQQTKHLM